MRVKWRPSPVARQRMRLAAFAAVLFLVGVLVGSITAPSGVEDRHDRALVSPSKSRAVRAAIISAERLAAPHHVGRSVIRGPEMDASAVRAKVSMRDQLASGRPKVADGADEDVPGHGLQCPAEDESGFAALQIPLKHLPRGKKTSVAEKYNRRAHNCVSNGIWNRVTISDHHKILHNMVRLGRIQKKSFVLDWGSGCGHSLQFLYDEYDVTGVGIDVSNLTIAYARSNTTKANLHCVADGTKLEWIPPNFFDHALSFGSIYHVYNRTMFCHVLRQLVRVVKPGGTVYNGWTENAEYKRAHVELCLADLAVDYQILEEKKEFADVAIFPLKAQQDVPNTYSLVITKKVPTVDEDQFLLENIPLSCGVHKCEPRHVVRREPGGTSAATENPLDRQDAAVDTEALAAGVVPSPNPHQDAARGLSGVDDDDKEGWPQCPPYDEEMNERLQIPLEHLPRKKKTSVAQKYDRRAHNCASHGVWHKVTIEDHEAILRRVGELLEVKRDEVLFDWGSGCGHQLAFMTRMFGARGLGIDVSNLTIAYARENTTKVNRHCVADGSRLDWLPTGFFDHAYSFGSVYHVYNKTTFCRVLQQMIRVVKVGGKIYNGWTENREFHRNDLVKCINTDTSSHHKISVLEEVDLFAHVKNFPLKQYRKVPNTYSLLVVKEG